MELREIIIVPLIAIFFAKHVGCFSIASPDKITLELGMEVISDRQLFLPLGWPAEISCDAAKKLREINVLGTDKFEWKIRYASSNYQEDVVNRNGTQFGQLAFYLHIQKATRVLHKAVLECFVYRPGHNTTLVSRMRLEIQDCDSTKADNQSAYNLHNPCAYGKCQLTERKNAVECICFRQYTGFHCNKMKSNAWIQDVIPYAPSLLIILLFVLYQSLSGTRKERKREKLMAISGFAGFSDRANFELSHLYPFIRKIRKCRYDSDEEVEESSEKKKRRAKRREAEGLKRVLEADATTGASTGGVTGQSEGTTTSTQTQKKAEWNKVEKKRNRRKRKRVKKEPLPEPAGQRDGATVGAEENNGGTSSRMSVRSTISVYKTEADDVSERRKDQIE